MKYYGQTKDGYVLMHNDFDVFQLHSQGMECIGSKVEVEKALDTLLATRKPAKGLRAFLVGLYQRVSKTL